MLVLPKVDFAMQFERDFQPVLLKKHRPGPALIHLTSSLDWDSHYWGPQWEPDQWHLKIQGRILTLLFVVSTWHKNRHMWNNFEWNWNDRSAKTPGKQKQWGKTGSGAAGTRWLGVTQGLLSSHLYWIHLASCFFVQQRTHSLRPWLWDREFSVALVWSGACRDRTQTRCFPKLRLWNSIPEG